MRKKKAKKRVLLPDPKFNDQLVTRFVNMMMWDGKKSVAFKIFYDAIDIVEEKNTIWLGTHDKGAISLIESDSSGFDATFYTKEHGLPTINDIKVFIIRGQFYAGCGNGLLFLHYY